MNCDTLRRELAARSCSSVRKKSARSRSSMFTNTTRARPRSAASFQARAVPTSTPMTPETVTRAPSTTRARGSQLTLEARVARDVDQIELALLPGRVLERHRDRELALVLVLIRIGDRRPGLDRPEPVDRTRLEEERLDERRLPRPTVADDCDIADLWRARAWVSRPPRVRFGCKLSQQQTARVTRLKQCCNAGSLHVFPSRPIVPGPPKARMRTCK